MQDMLENTVKNVAKRERNSGTTNGRSSSKIFQMTDLLFLSKIDNISRSLAIKDLNFVEPFALKE